MENIQIDGLDVIPLSFNSYEELIKMELQQAQISKAFPDNNKHAKLRFCKIR